MLIQSEAGELQFLPALPKAWSRGEVTGLRARGGLEVDVQWTDGLPATATLRPTVDGVHVLQPPPEFGMAASRSVYSRGPAQARRSP
jgi:alpha-L-fucosidase 2